MERPIQFAFGAYRLDTGRRVLLRDGRPVRLMPKDVAVLTALVERRGEVVTRERLRALVWPDVVVEDCNLARHVATVRQALGDTVEAPAFIETLPKVGYRFVAEVRQAEAVDLAPEAAPAPASQAELPPAPPGEPLPPAAASPARRPFRAWLRAWRRPRPAYAAIGGLVASALVGWMAAAHHADATGPIRSLTVLRIQNLTGDPRQDHLAEALHAMMETDLARHHELGVVARTPSERLEQGELPPREIASRLGVEGYFEAAIVRADEQVRVTAAIIDARTDRLVWAESFQGAAEDFPELQDVVTSAALEALQLSPLPAEQSGVSLPVQLAGHRSSCSPPAPVSASP